MKRSKLACVLIAFSLLAVACGSDEESAPSTLKIGYAADFSDLGGFADMPASQAANHFVAFSKRALALVAVKAEHGSRAWHVQMREATTSRGTLVFRSAPVAR